MRLAGIGTGKVVTEGFTKTLDCEKTGRLGKELLEPLSKAFQVCAGTLLVGLDWALDPKDPCETSCTLTEREIELDSKVLRGVLVLLDVLRRLCRSGERERGRAERRPLDREADRFRRE